MVAPSGCATLPAALSLPALAGGGCAGQRVRLALPTPPAGANLQWETAPDSLAWTPVAAATDTVYEALVTAPAAYYRVRAACGGAQAVSPGRRVAPDPNRCYCATDASLYQFNLCAPGYRIGRLQVANTTLDLPDGTCLTPRGAPGRTLPPFPANQTAQLQQGGLYQVDMTGPVGAGPLYGWLDANRNGQFEAAEYFEFAYRDSAGTRQRGELQVPTGASLGPTGLRLRRGIDAIAPWQGGPHACTRPAYGETLDLQVTLVPPACPAGPPAAGRIEGSTAFCLGTVPALALRYQAPNTAVQWQTAPDNLAWTDMPGATALALASAQPFVDTLYVRAQVRCGTGPPAFTAAVRVLPDALLCFCQPTNGTVYAPMARLRLGNTPLYPAPARAYPPTRPANTATLLAGIAYPVANRPQGSASVPPNRPTTWNNVAGLDADGSGRFAPGELTPLRVYPFATYGDSLATLRVPPTATPGARVRWRVYATAYNRTLYPTSACDIGEVMDFVVTLAAPPPSAGPLTAGRVRGGAARTVCPGQRVRLEALGYSRGADLLWEQQVGAGPWLLVRSVLATEEVLVSAPLAVATAFRVRAIGPSGAQAWSAPVAVALTPALCPCTANLGGNNLNSVGGRLLGTLSEVMVRGPRSYMRCRHVGAPPRANNSVYTDLSLRGDSTHTTLYRGEAGQLDTRSVASSNIFDACDIGAWLDFNANGRFEPSEFVQCTDGTGRFTVPATAALGPVRLRVRSQLFISGLTPAFGPNDACRALVFGMEGETEDYTLTIADAPPCDAPDLTFAGSTAVGGTVQLGTRLPLPAGLSTFWEGPGGFTSAQARPTLAGLTLAQSGYYLLTLRDASGDFELTAARYLQVGQGLATTPSQTLAAAISVFPNPATSQATVRLAAPNTGIFHTLQVLNSTGQVVLSQSLGRHNQLEIPLNLAGFAPGLYLVKIRGEQNGASCKMMVE